MRIIKQIIVSLILTIGLSFGFTHSVFAAKKPLNVVAVGDSLTYGIGDHHHGGYTSLIKKPLKKASQRPVHVQNFGISGETSTQILQRVRDKPALIKAIKQSDIITITAGGNDIMHVLQKRGLKLSQEQFQQAKDHYVKQMVQMIMLIRRYNERAPIYLIGIYNPFAIYVKKAKSVKQAVIAWNQASQDIARDNYRMHFVDVSALANPKKVKYSKKEQTTINPLLYTKDYFHPNHKGYQIMTQKLWQQMKNTKKEWLKLS
ncbi:GDSL-type esterase/lipase family protein [Bombilactobacillus folatiphilus]|uniref:GDSL-type esterase/lipase family protein n=1 Tax=Bombilactobacillus folatiphilus TaxID=2923362 RepID=A0ABY4PAW4_9LACO|nr:GDSL-type esterase/lipase family protein [Bombilactobacillus folatiphilus]UQS82784.1 GDSL-type esterase/lipase family protein [Bombilactobacillus folatiphilus]